MGSGLVYEEYSKVEHLIVFLVIAGITIHAFTKYSAISFDAVSFTIFAAMCFAGYFALKSAQEIAAAIEDRKRSAIDGFKADMLVINPMVFNKNSKYATSIHSKSLKTAL